MSRVGLSSSVSLDLSVGVGMGQKFSPRREVAVSPLGSREVDISENSNCHHCESGDCVSLLGLY